MNIHITPRFQPSKITIEQVENGQVMQHKEIHYMADMNPDDKKWCKVTITAYVKEYSKELAVNSLLLYLKLHSPAQIKPFAAEIDDLQAVATDKEAK